MAFILFHPNFWPTLSPCPASCLITYCIMAFQGNQEVSLEWRILMSCKPSLLYPQIYWKQGILITYRKGIFPLLWVMLRIVALNMNIFNTFLAVFLSMVSFICGIWFCFFPLKMLSFFSQRFSKLSKSGVGRSGLYTGKV